MHTELRWYWMIFDIQLTLTVAPRGRHKIAPRLTLTIPIMTEFNIADFKALVKRTRSKTSLLAGVAKEKLSTLALAWADKDAKVDKGEIDFINMGEGFVSTRMRRLRRIPQWLSTG